MSFAYAFRCDAYLGDGRSCPSAAVVDAPGLVLALERLVELGWHVVDDSQSANQRHVCRRCGPRWCAERPSEVAP